MTNIAIEFRSTRVAARPANLPVTLLVQAPMHPSIHFFRRVARFVRNESFAGRFETPELLDRYFTRGEVKSVTTTELEEGEVRHLLEAEVDHAYPRMFVTVHTMSDGNRTYVIGKDSEKFYMPSYILLPPDERKQGGPACSECGEIMQAAGGIFVCLGCNHSSNT